MRIFTILAAAAFSATTANAAELANISAADVSAFKITVPAPALPALEAAPKCGHVSGEITKLHLLAQPAKSFLFSTAKTEAEFKEFVEMWTPILAKFDIKVTGTEFNSGLSKLNYAAPEGRVLREYMAEKLHYNALDPAEIKKLQHELLEPLEQAGMTPVASFTIKHEIFRPTFNIYYLTKPAEEQAKETQLRQLMTGEDIDYDLLAGPVSLVKKDTTFSMVYIGRELGFMTKVSATEEGINKKVADFKKILTDNKMELIAARVFKMDKPFTVGDTTYNYAANIYFFR